MKNDPMPNLFEVDSRPPLPQAFVDNLAQIYPKHLIHGIIPKEEEKELACSGGTYSKIQQTKSCTI